MPRIRTLQRAFNGGILSPSMWGQVENTKFQTGVADSENMIPWPQGVTRMRPGTEFVSEVYDSTKTSVLRTFRAGASTSYTVGVEEGRFKFYIDGSVLLWATARQVSSISTSANTVTFTSAHGFTANQQIRLVKPAASTAPTGTGITVTANMYAIVVNSTTIQITATSLGAAIDITGAGSGTLWFYAGDEIPADYVTSKNASGVTALTNLVNVTSHGLAHGNPVEFTASLGFTAATTDICTAVGHGLTTDTPVTVVSSGTLPGGLTAGVTYYVEVLGADTFRLLHVPAANLISPDIVDITDTGSGTHTLSVADGGLVLASSPALYAGTTYYARKNDDNSFTVHTTEADALAGTNTVDITGAGPGVTKVHYAYSQGDLVNYPNSGIYYCEISHPKDSAPGSGDWYLLPFTGDYEVPNSYIESNLLNLDWEQIGDTMTFAHPDHGLYALRRISDLQWTFNSVSLEPPIDAPANLAVTATAGENLECTFTNASPAVFTTPTFHGFVDNGTTVYLDVLTGTVGSGDGYYVINTTPTDSTFTLKQMDGGEAVDSSSTGTATVRFSPLSIDVTNNYFVTAVRADGVESQVSNEVEVVNNLATPGAYNTLRWSAVSGAERYRVYKALHGLAGFIGETYERVFRDDNIGPDLGITPPIVDDTIGVTGYQPGVLSSFEQRRILSNVEADEQTLWFTDTGTLDSLTYHLPLIDTDRIKAPLYSPLSAAVRYVVPLTNLVILTESTEFVMTTINSEALTPTSFRARPVSYVGCAKVKPQVINDRLVFCANRGGHVYEFGLKAAFEGYEPKDICLYAPHLFDGYTIVDMALQRAPVPVLWFVRSDGALLGYTFAPEEAVGGWHIHRTNGFFERICASAEGDEDRPYFIVRRTIDGSTVRYVERLGSMLAVTDIEDAYHVDCGVTYDGTAATTISGLDHLEGEAVVANTDGLARTDMTVTDGAVSMFSYTLPTSASKAHIGLSYEGFIRTLPSVAPSDNALVQGRVKGAAKAYAQVENSGPFVLGPTNDELELTPAGTAGELSSDAARIVLPNGWTEGGQIYIKQPYPLPLSIVNLTLEIDLGGG